MDKANNIKHRQEIVISRAFSQTLQGRATGIAITQGADASTNQTVTGAATLISTMTYKITEGRIAGKSVGDTTQKIQDAVEAVKSEGGGA